MSTIIDILTGIGDLQATLHGNAIADDEVMERLNTMRKTALEIMDNGKRPAHAADGYRNDALDKAEALWMLVGVEGLKDIPDITLFRMAAAADNFASSVKTYMKMRNLLAAEQAYREHHNVEVQ